MRGFRARRRTKAALGFAAGVRRQRDVGRMAALCRRMFDSYGGLDGFAARWKAEIDKVLLDHPGSPAAVRQLLAILLLSEQAETALKDFAKNQEHQFDHCSAAKLQKAIDDYQARQPA